MISSNNATSGDNSVRLIPSSDYVKLLYVASIDLEPIMSLVMSCLLEGAFLGRWSDGGNRRHM